MHFNEESTAHDATNDIQGSWACVSQFITLLFCRYRQKKKIE